MRLSTRILIGYSVVCITVLGVLVYITYGAGQLEIAPPVASLIKLALCSFLFGAYPLRRFGLLIEAVSVSDRRVALVQFVWVYGPILVATTLLVIWLLFDDLPVAIPGTELTFLEIAFRWIAMLVSTTWVLISAPIARLWATNKAKNPEALLRAEECLFVSKRQREIEADIPMPTYYAMVLGILAMLFLIFESIVGELFEHVTRMSGYVGAMVAALGVAGLLYPIRRRIHAFAARMQEEAQISGRAEALSAVRSAIASTSKYFAAGFSDAFDDLDGKTVSQRPDQPDGKEGREEVPRLNIGWVVGSVCAVISAALVILVLFGGAKIISRGIPDFAGVVILVMVGALAWFFATTSYRLLLNRPRSAGGGILPPTLVITLGAVLCFGGVWMLSRGHLEGSASSLVLGPIFIWTGLSLRKRDIEAKKTGTLPRPTDN